MNKNGKKNFKLSKLWFCDQIYENLFKFIYQYSWNWIL